MFKKPKADIQIGDKFVKTDDPRVVWIVSGNGSPVAPVPHYQVVRDGSANRVRTLSETVLLDTDFYRRVE